MKFAVNVIVSKVAYQTINSEFKSNWLPYMFNIVPKQILANNVLVVIF